MKNLFAVFCACLATLEIHTATAQTTLTFDALLPGNDWAVIQNGYGSVQWHNFGVFNGANRPLTEGYRTGTVSPNNVAFNPYGEPASVQSDEPFNLDSAYLTAAFVNGLHVRVQGFSGTNVTYDNTYTLNPSSPNLIQFNYAGVDMVRFVATPESHFVVDNLTVTVAVSNVPCTFVISPAERLHTVESENGTIDVATSADCAWTVANTNSWVAVLSSLENTNSGIVTYQVEANATGLPRSGFITVAGQSFVVSQSAFQTPGTNTVNLGMVEASTLGHAFLRPPRPPPGGPLLPNSVADFLVDQDQSSGGGGLLPFVSVNWDTNRHFALTVAAPPGKKFLVQVPAGQAVRFSGYLWWQAGGGGISPPGSVSVSFSGLEGVRPDFSASGSVLSDSHGFFGCNYIESTLFTNDLAFASMELCGTVAPQQTGTGTQGFTPHPASSLLLMYSTMQTNDPGPFVSIVTDDPPMAARAVAGPPDLTIGMEPNGDIVITFTGTLQSAPNLSGPFDDVPGLPKDSYTIPKASVGTPQYFRSRRD